MITIGVSRTPIVRWTDSCPLIDGAKTKNGSLVASLIVRFDVRSAVDHPCRPRRVVSK